jgi:uncharacterized protein YgiM (DUF1202 family)
MTSRSKAALAALALAALALAGPASPAVAADTAIRGTPVTRIRALVNLNIRTGPSLHNRVVGKLRTGHHATVTGASDNYGWWRIRCPWGGVCWVSANPNYAKPVAWRR